MTKRFHIASQQIIASSDQSANESAFVDLRPIKELTNDCLHECMGALATVEINIESVTTTVVPRANRNGSPIMYVLAVTMIASAER